MSFGKAKIQRFNDIKVAQAPTPTSYNVEKKKTVDKLKLETKNKVAKYTVAASNDGDKNSVVSDGLSARSAPPMKTPLATRCKKFYNRIQPKTPKRPEADSNPQLEALKEKTVECNNKDAFIKELSEHIEELKDRVDQLKREKDQIEVDKKSFEESVCELNKNHQVKMEEVIKKNEMKLIDLATEKDQLLAEIVQLKQKYEDIEHSHEKEIKELIQKLNNEKTAELYKKEKALVDLEAKYAETQKNSQQEIDTMRKEHQMEIQDLEFEMLKAMTELQKERENTEDKIREVEEQMRREIKRLQERFSEEKRLLHEESSRRINEIEQNLKQSNYLTETKLKEEMEQIILEWQNKLQMQQTQSNAILKECQAISEYNIIQSEVEKNNIKLELDKIKEEYTELQDKYNTMVSEHNETLTKHKELQVEMSKIVQELNDVRTNLHTELERKSGEINKLEKEKATYEYTIKNSQTTINVLKERLIHSDRDVEQLKQELAESESKILEYEEKYIKLDSDLKDRQSYNDELEMQFESAIRLNYTDISKLGNELFKKLDQYKQEGLMYNEKYKKEKQLKEETMNQLKDAFELISKIKLELDTLEMLNNQYEFEIDQYQNELDDYHMREMDWSLMKDKFEDIISQMQCQLDKKDSEIKSLTNKLGEFEDKLSSNLNYTEYYENKVKEYERELNDTGNIHKRYIEMSGKYDELAQRFEELDKENTKMKSKIGSLTKEVEEQSQMGSKYQKQKKMYDKLLSKYQNLEKEMECSKGISKGVNLNKENAEPKSARRSKLAEGNKENVSSPNRLLNSSRLDSPLRDRN